MKLKILFIIFITVFVSTISCVAQKHGTYATKSKKAIKLFEGAMDFYKMGKSDNAVAYLQRAIEKDENFVDAYLFLGDIYADRNRTDAALEKYYKVMEINPDYFPKVFYMAAVLEMDKMEYEKAADHLRTYLQSPSFDKRLKEKVLHYIDVCDFSAGLMKHPVSFNPRNLGANINSSYDEYVNAVNTENNLLIFTVKHKANGQRRLVEDFLYSIKDKSGEWMPRRKMDKIFNTGWDEGAMSISPDGRLIVFASNREGGFGRFDLYYSVKENGRWTEPKNMGDGVNTAAWESQPSISSDGKTIYFVSDRNGGYGGSDIYFVTLQEDGSYGKPVNLGSGINTSGNEMSPFIHQDDHTLYFVSNGHIGMGGSDVFYSRRNKKGFFDNAVNIGYPINSNKNELGMVVDATGVLAYISSDKNGGFGKFDIYNFELYDEARPVPVTYLKGVVYDKITKKRLKVDFDLINLKTGEVWVHSSSDKATGEFLLCIPQNTNFALNAYRDGYLFYSDNFHVDGVQPVEKPFVKNVPMTPIVSGQSIVLENVFFATNSYELRPESEVELKKLRELLVRNPGLKVEIAGHTDNVGGAGKNQILSENRAKAVYNYLVSHGIPAARLSYKGYGETKPVATNDTPEGRQKNRRTEMIVLGH